MFAEMIGRLKISEKQLEDMLSEAFEHGHSGCFELKAQCIQELIENIKSQDQGLWRIFTVDEIRKLPSGTKLYHSQLGAGQIHDFMLIGSSPSQSEKYIQFRKDKMELNDQSWPWTEPMRLIAID